MIDGVKQFKFTDEQSKECYLKNRNAHRRLNLNYLLNKFLKASDHKYCNQYKKTPGKNAVKGQFNEEGQPSGLVRKIAKNGDIWDGQMTPDY